MSVSSVLSQGPEPMLKLQWLAWILSLEAQRACHLSANTDSGMPFNGTTYNIIYIYLIYITKFIISCFYIIYVPDVSPTGDVRQQWFQPPYFPHFLEALLEGNKHLLVAS